MHYRTQQGNKQNRKQTVNSRPPEAKYMGVLSLRRDKLCEHINKQQLNSIYFHMKKFTLFLGLTFSGFLLCALVFSQKSEFPVKWISFDEIIVNEELHLRAVEDKITNIFDTIIGNYVILKEGVYGSSLLLDGYSAYLFSNNLPDLKGSFSVEGWLAPVTYPTNYCPVAEQINLENKGFSL